MHNTLWLVSSSISRHNSSHICVVMISHRLCSLWTKIHICKFCMTYTKPFIILFDYNWYIYIMKLYNHHFASRTDTDLVSTHFGLHWSSVHHYCNLNKQTAYGRHDIRHRHAFSCSSLHFVTALVLPRVLQPTLWSQRSFKLLWSSWPSTLQEPSGSIAAPFSVSYTWKARLNQHNLLAPIDTTI